MKFVRYLLVQIAAYGIDMGGFLLMVTYLSLNPIYANVFSKTAAGIVAFLAHRSFTFRLDRNEWGHAQATKYFILLGINLPLSSAILVLMLYVIPFASVAKLITDVLLVLLNFWLSQHLVFKGNSRQKMMNDPSREEAE